MSLYNISSEYAELLEKIDEIAEWDAGTDADGHYVDENGNVIPDPATYREEMTAALFDTLEAVEGELGNKLANCAAYAKQLKVEADALNAEAKVLKDRYAKKSRALDRLKTYIQDCMEVAGLKKIDEPLAKISIRQNAESVSVASDAELIDWAISTGHDDLLRFSAPDINKTAIKHAIAAGEEIPGCSMVRTKSLIIK